MENQINETADFGIPEIPGVEEFDLAEWVFQFDDDEPVVIAWSNSEEEAGELTFMIKANSESSVIFKSSDGTKTMKLFSRRMPESRRQELREQRIREQELFEKLNNQEPSDEV